MKRKLIAVFMLLTLLLSGCSKKVTSIESDTTTSMFVAVEKAGLWEVVYHKETKVMYVISLGAYNGGNFTLLVDADGKPMLWEEK